jgi:surface polysaccharide O-acyltransferase-like enzyme
MMNHSEKTFDAKESLSLITSMIETTKASISDSSHYYLLWGWMVFAGCSIQYILLVIVKYPQHYYAWFVTPIALLVFFIMLFRDKRKQKVKTFISEASGYVWSAVGFSFLPLSFIFSKIGWQYSFPFYILLYGIGTYISGGLLNFKPLRIGGAICLLLAAFTPYVAYEHQILLTALAILISYIIPGHMLRNRYRVQNQLQHG